MLNQALVDAMEVCLKRAGDLIQKPQAEALITLLEKMEKVHERFPAELTEESPDLMLCVEFSRVQVQLGELVANLQSDGLLDGGPEAFALARRVLLINGISHSLTRAYTLVRQRPRTDQLILPGTKAVQDCPPKVGLVGAV